MEKGVEKSDSRPDGIPEEGTYIYMVYLSCIIATSNIVAAVLGYKSIT